jgi:hypothetical protein
MMMIRARLSRMRRTARMAIAVAAAAVVVACTPVTYQGHSYSTSAIAPTADKPQSKLWYNDGAWWALMVAPSAKVQIFELLSNHTWRDTGTVVDDRTTSTGDALWDGAAGKLYVGSRADGGGQVRLARLSYNSSTRSYSMDSGFPDPITANGSESLTIAKDSTGLLWATQVRNGKVYVTHTVAGSGDLDWRSLFQPAGGTSACTAGDITCTNEDDISAVVTLPGKIGVLWSNQLDSTFHFAVHVDGANDNAWTTEVAYTGPLSTDDHLNIKNVTSASDGRLFAAVKTNTLASADPLCVLLVRSNTGVWTNYTYSTRADDQTRPIVVIDEPHKQLYYFAAKTGGGSAIWYKKTSLDNISFGPGKGDPFVKFDGATDLNNPSSSKQVVNATTNIVVLASDEAQDRYYHAELDIA